MANSILEHISVLPDPRGKQGRQHLLQDIVTIAVCGVICGADEWTAISQFGEAKAKWFKTFLDLPNGIPSHDTFGTVFAAMDPTALEIFLALQQNLWVVSGSGRAPSAWYKAISAAPKVRKP